MEQVPLLQTKLHIPPIRREVVSRPRLVERLNEGLGRKLTLISAPAGFGKTTLVSEWASHFRLGIGDWGFGSPEDESIQNRKSQIANRVAWLSLDEGDGDLTRFLAYLIAALRTVGTDMGTGALSVLQSPQSPPVEAVLTSLINEVATIPDRMVLVLDDYHLIEAQEIHDAVGFLLKRMPLQMHVVIASREDPPLPLARLRARGQLTELRATDLRFSSSEAAEFLNQAMGLDLSAEEVAALVR